MGCSSSGQTKESKSPAPTADPEPVNGAVAPPAGQTAVDKSSMITRPSEFADDQPSMEEDEDERRFKQQQNRGKRGGIAAESVDQQAVKDYVKPVYQKEESVQQRIREVLKTNDKMAVLFGHLEGAPLQDVINAFQIGDASQGQDLIVQGAEGDRLYIISEGAVDVHVARPNEDGSMPERGPKVAQLPKGALFGELALMYSAPRAATITVASPSLQFWSLDREPFKMLLAQNSQATLEKYEGWLKDVEIFKTLNHFELAKLSECLHSELFDKDDVIITQGEVGDRFFIVEDGTCSAFIAGDGGEKEVKQYTKQGDYFGELAMLNKQPRAATVRATGEGCSVASMTNQEFINLLGPIDDILRKHAGMYPQYAEFLK